MKRIAVVDYQLNNIDSVVRAVEECGGTPVVTSRRDEIESCTSIILPGVGAFRDGMAKIHELGLDAVLRDQAAGGRVRLLGLCLGMQLLADRGAEGGGAEGLGLIAGEVRRLEPDRPGVRVPHVGWNSVAPVRDSPLLEGLAPGSDFYFVHSYHFVPASGEAVLATTDYCGGFVSAVQVGNVLGLQFHPEKSQRNGLRVLRNFVDHWG